MYLGKHSLPFSIREQHTYCREQVLPPDKTVTCRTQRRWGRWRAPAAQNHTTTGGECMYIRAAFILLAYWIGTYGLEVTGS